MTVIQENSAFGIPFIPTPYVSQADEETVRWLVQENTAYCLRIAVEGAFDPTFGDLLWVQEPFYQEWYQASRCYGMATIYQATPGTLYDWLDADGGYHCDVPHEYFRHWHLRPAEELPMEQARFVWAIKGKRFGCCADLVATPQNGIMMMQRAQYRPYPYVLEVVCHYRIKGAAS